MIITPGGAVVKNPPANAGALGLIWGIPWTEEPGGLQSMGLQAVWHNWPHPYSNAQKNPQLHLAACQSCQ